MNRQKSFSNNVPTLFLVATPIGNLDEITVRAVNTLKEVEVIAAEDTRNTIKLLNHFNITTKMISHHEHNLAQSSKKIIDFLSNGQNVALVSDAGYPAISDPGFDLVTMCIEKEFNVVSISGANACLNALVVSGIAPQPFLFYGFLDHQDKNKKKQLIELSQYKETIVLYESPHRIKKTLILINELLGDRQIALCRELTKKFEEIIRGTVSEVLDVIDEVKGEMVIVVSGSPEVTVETNDEKDVIIHIDDYINKGMSAKDAVKEVSVQRKMKKNEVYNIYLNNKK